MNRPPPRSTLFPTPPLSRSRAEPGGGRAPAGRVPGGGDRPPAAELGWGGRAMDASVWLAERSEEHTSELQSRQYLVCRLLLEKKKKKEPKTNCATSP